MYFLFGQSFNLGFERDAALFWSNLLRVICFIFGEGIAQGHMLGKYFLFVEVLMGAAICT